MNTRVDSQGIFPTQGLNPGLLHCRWILYCLSHQGSPRDGAEFRWKPLYFPGQGNGASLAGCQWEESLAWLSLLLKRSSKALPHPLFLLVPVKSIQGWPWQKCEGAESVPGCLQAPCTPVLLPSIHSCDLMTTSYRLLLPFPLSPTGASC